MRMLAVIMIFTLLLFLGFGIYILYLNLPGEPVEYEDYKADLDNGNFRTFVVKGYRVGAYFETLYPSTFGAYDYFKLSE